MAGVSPIGVIEPFNQYQNQGLSELANFAPQPTSQGYMIGNQAAYQKALGQAGNLPIAESFAAGSDLYNTANQQLRQGTREFGDSDFASGLARYYNPFQEQVIDRSVSRINEQGDMVRNRLMARAPGSKSFGASSGAIQMSELDKNLFGQVADTASSLGYQGYNTAAGYARDDFSQARNRNLTAAGQAGNMAANRMDDGFQGFQGLQDLVNTGVNANDAYWRNYQGNVDNAMLGIQNKIAAGGAIQNQNQRMLDAVQGEYGRMEGFDKSQLADLSEFLAPFLQSGTSIGEKAPTTNTLGKIAGLANVGNSLGQKMGWFPGIGG